MLYFFDMTLDALIMLAGALVAFLAYPGGFPPSFYKPMFFILGVFVVALGIIVRRQRGERETAERKRAQASGNEDAAPRAHEETLV